MSTLLNVCGTFVIVIGFISGILSGSFLGFIFGVIGSVVSSILFFALAKISDVQETILYRLQANDHSRDNLYYKEANKVCVSCDYRYNSTLSSCPNCGYRR
ncbi:hypothetical protein SAMN05877753_11353 [Bacillus oleivorans]|uniref:Zinc ribbon protein n=1 Tax=Bacillus oleivorans TaxID=1448271 RepID=A0A285D8P0_9BACI|nr:hypothetical protein [Bacillus oleivorans]SNX75553.1 hypothetical protein SAMN05877753_11353 [Bacillus oleivorans]